MTQKKKKTTEQREMKGRDGGGGRAKTSLSCRNYKKEKYPHSFHPWLFAFDSKFPKSILLEAKGTA